MFFGGIVTAMRVEQTVRDEFNKLAKTNSHKETVSFGKSGPKHEFDIFEKGKVVGGVSTSPWFNKPNAQGKKSGNTAGQDRASAELLWLSLWQGPERRVHILTDSGMAERIFKKYKGAAFARSIEIHHYEVASKSFRHVGTL